MLRHERQTVAIEPAAALHHSRDVGLGKHDGLRAQTTASSGSFGEVSEPQEAAATVGYVAARTPLIWWGPPRLADSSAEAMDGRTPPQEEPRPEGGGRGGGEEEEGTAGGVAVLFVPLGEEEEEEEASSDVRTFLFSPRSLSTGGGMLQAGFLQFTLCFLLTLAGLSCWASWSVWTRMSFHLACRRLRQWHLQGWFCWLLLALCSLLSLTGPRCSASWPFWTRRTVTSTLVACLDGLLVTLHLALCFFPCRQAPDALHHGRCGSEVQLCRCCLVDLCLLCATTGALGLEVQKSADFPQLKFYNKVVHIPVLTLWPHFMVQPVWLTTEIPQLLFDIVLDVPMWDVQVLLLHARFALGFWTIFHGPEMAVLFGTRRLSSTKIRIFPEMTSCKCFHFRRMLWFAVDTSTCVSQRLLEEFSFFLRAGGLLTLRSTLVGLLLVRDGLFAAEMQHFSVSVHLDVESRGGGDAGSLTPRCSATQICCVPV